MRGHIKQVCAVGNTRKAGDSGERRQRKISRRKWFSSYNHSAEKNLQKKRCVKGGGIQVFTLPDVSHMEDSLSEKDGVQYFHGKIWKGNNV